MTDPIKAKIQSLCPDVIEGTVGAYNANHCPHCAKEFAPKIALAVVLRAIEKLNVGATLFIDTSGQWYGKNSQLKLAESGYLHRELNWNLAKDNYDDQPEETKRFIGSLLGV
jgi:hypothetical protein